MASTDLRSYGTNKDLGGTNPNQIGLYAYNRARSAGLSASQISQLGQSQNVTFGIGLQGRIVNDITSDLSLGYQRNLNGYQSQIQGLTGQMEEQRSQFADQQAQFQDSQQAFQTQITEQQDEFATQQKASQATIKNYQNASVPVAERTAPEKSLQGPTTVTKKRPGLSSLSIVSGLGTSANPLSGLQLA